MQENAGKNLREQGDPVNHLVEAIRLDIDLSGQLPDEFFPAHTSVALIDAVFNPQLKYEAVVVPILDRYCHHFGLSRMRTDRKTTPPSRKQETLDDLIRHYERHGARHMRERVFQSKHKSPGTNVYKAENVLWAAQALRRMGVNTLQDAQRAASRSPEEIKCALRPLRGIGDRTIHMLLMYLGNDDFVKGDMHVCRFVRGALADNSLRPRRIEELVRAAAKRIAVKPRFLDYAIWRYGAARLKVVPQG